MKTAKFKDSKTSIWLGVLFCAELVFCVALTGCGNDVLRDFDRLEKEALKYGTVSVGAVRITDYNEAHLWDSRMRLREALKNIQNHLTNEPNTPSQRSTAAIEDPNKTTSKTKNKKTEKSQAPWPGEIEEIGLRMAALKFIESELEDIDLVTTSPVEPNFRRVVVSLDCSAWVRGKAGAALVYIDLYPYEVDKWCHEAAKILECWRDEIKDSNSSEELEIQKRYKCCWNNIAKDKLKSAFKPSALPTRVQMPKKSEIEKHDPCDWEAFCHRLLEKREFLPQIVYVERMGRAEYLTLAEADYSSSKFGIGIKHPAGPSAEWATETRREDKRKMESLRQLSLAFVAGERRAGWLFMPGKTTEGKMAPTERRLRMVVDVPKELETLAIHIHKVFLGPDLGILDGAALSKQIENLKKTRKTLTRADDLYEEHEKTMPSHYRLIKTRIRNLLYQGWAEEFEVDIPKSKKKVKK
jgi:hypothetical protein